MRDDAEASVHSTGKPVVRLTQGSKVREDPSMEFQPLSNEEKDIKNHIIQNVCSKFGTDTDKLVNFPVYVSTRSMFKNDWIWAAFCLSEEGGKLKRL